MGLCKWLINPHPGIFQFCLNLFILQNKFGLGEMGQTDKRWVTDNCSVIPTERMKRERFFFFLMKPVPWPRRQHFNLKPYSASSSSANTASLRGGPVSGNLPPHQDLEARPQLFLNKDKTTVVRVSSLSVFSGIPKPPRSKSLPGGNSAQSRQHTKTRLGPP